MNKIYVIALLLICLSFSVSAAQLLKGLYPCITNASRTCQANNVQLVGGTLDTPEVVFIERFINDANCPFSGFVYQRYDGTTIQVNVSGILSPCSPIDGGTDYSWDAKKIGNYVYIFYIRQVGSYPITETYLQITRIDLATSSYSVFSSTYTVLIWGAIGIVDVAAVASNSVLYHIVGGGSVFWATLYSNGTLQAGGKSTTNTLKPYAFAYSSFFNATGYTKLFGRASTGPPRMYVFNSSMDIISNDTVISDANARNVYSIGENLIVYSTDIDGNYELYYATINSSGVGTRLTTTAADEILTSVLKSSSNDGTYYLVYNTTGGTYVTSVCNSSMILGYTCSQSQSATIYPDVMLTTWDNGCCQQGCNYFPFNSIPGYRPDQCSQCCPIPGTLEDWVSVQYTVNGKYAVPASFDSIYYNDSRYLTGINTSCKACCMSCTYNPGCVDLVFNNLYAMPSGFGSNVWSKNLGEANPPFGTYAWRGNSVTIVCNTNMTNTQAITRQQVENSAVNFSFWSYVSGANGEWDDSVSTSQQPAFRTTFSTSPVGGLSSWQGSYSCLLNVPTLGITDSSMWLVESALSNGVNTQKWNYLYSGLPSSGYSEFVHSVNCFASQTVNYVRMPSRFHQRRTAVTSDCSGNNPTAISNFQTLADYTANRTVNSSIFTGQNFFARFRYVDSSQLSLGNQCGARCTMGVYNATSGVLYNNLMTLDYTSCSMGSGYWAGLVYTNDDVDGYFQIAGKYTLNVSCISVGVQRGLTGQPYCLAPANYNWRFTVNSSSCEGTSWSCGTTSCDVCSDRVCTCEDGISLTISQDCSNQICGAGIQRNCIDVCSSHQIYSVNAWSSSPQYSCNNPPIKLNAQILQNNGVIDGSRVSSGCVGLLTYGQGNVNQPGNIYGFNFGLTYDPLTYVYSWSYLTSATKPQIFCGSNYTARISCNFNNNSITKNGYTGFVLAQSNVFCNDEWSTSKYQCVFERSGIDSDKPKYCGDSLTIVNKSSICGCPSGYSINASTDGCDGSGQIDLNINNYMTLTNLLILILLVPIGLVAYSILTRK